MGDGQRFWRYAVPGAVFLVQLILLLWLGGVDLVALLKTLDDKNKLVFKVEPAIAIAGAIVSTPVVGILLSHLHHMFTQIPGYRSLFRPNHIPTVRRLVQSGLLRINGVTWDDNQEPAFSTRRLNVSWMIITCLYHERTEVDAMLKGTIVRTYSWTDIMQAQCTVFVGTLFLIFAACFSHPNRIVLVTVVLFCLIAVHMWSACRVCRQFETYVDIILSGSLTRESLASVAMRERGNTEPVQERCLSPNSLVLPQGILCHTEWEQRFENALAAISSKLRIPRWWSVILICGYVSVIRYFVGS